MKRLILFFWGIVVITGQLSAQEVTYWVGTSTNSDPITRHHEAFMDAFMQYIQRGITLEMATQKGDEHSETISNGSESCKIEMVSSVTCEGRETLVIAVGSGVTITYAYKSISSQNETIVKTETSLLIRYEDKPRGTEAVSIHIYEKNSEVETISKSEIYKFHYDCDYLNVKE